MNSNARPSYQQPVRYLLFAAVLFTGSSSNLLAAVTDSSIKGRNVTGVNNSKLTYRCLTNSFLMPFLFVYFKFIVVRRSCTHSLVF